MRVVVYDPICDKFAPHKTYVYRFLKSYMGGMNECVCVI